MASRSRVCPVAEDEGRSLLGRRARRAYELLNCRQRICLVWLMSQRVAVGLCDLLLAAALYILFMRLQGSSLLHHLWWTPETVFRIAMATSVIVIVRALLDMLSTRYASRQIQGLCRDLMFRLLSGYNEMRWERFVERNRSELLSHAVHTTREAGDFYHRCVELVASIVVVVAMIAVLVYQSPTAAAGLGVAAILLYAVHRYLIREKLQDAASDREVSLRILQRHLMDMLASGQEVRTYLNQAFFFEKIREQSNRLGVSNQRVLLLPQIARILADQGVVLLFLCVVLVAQLQHGDTRQLLSLLVFYFALSRRLLPLISQISLIAGQMESSYENVSIVSAELGDCLLNTRTILPALLPGEGVVLELEQVSFAFGEGVPILRDVTLRLHKAQTMVLRGASGSGKSSLLNLIAGVSEPTAGTIRVDRSRIAYVPQESSLLDDTIRNNILFGLPEKSDAELRKAVAIARLEEFVALQALGLETGVGDNGILLSGGERQRLGLARAILRGATLLLLDEATSALDEDNERQVLENLSAFGIAIILVTHRAQTHPFGQRRFWLQEGYLIEDTSGHSPWDQQATASGQRSSRDIQSYFAVPFR